MSEKCPYCLAYLELRDGVFPYHDHPKPTRRVCSGAKKTPEVAVAEFKAWMEVFAEERF